MTDTKKETDTEELENLPELLDENEKKELKIEVSDSKLKEEIEEFRKKVASDIAKNEQSSHLAKLVGSRTTDGDLAISRLLVARKHDLNLAHQMFVNMIEFRRANKFDSVHDAPQPKYPELRKAQHHVYHKYDKQGRPIFIERTGLTDWKGLIKLATPDELVQYHIHVMEYMMNYVFPRASERAGKPIDKLTSILDLKGLGSKHLKKAAYALFKRMSKIDQDIYPEILGKLFIVNAPAIFAVAWKAIKPWVDPSTRQKITILRGDFQKVLLEHIDADQLPAYLGGKCQCQKDTKTKDWCIVGKVSEQELMFADLTRLGKAEFDKKFQGKRLSSIYPSTTTSGSTSSSTSSTSSSTTTSSS